MYSAKPFVIIYCIDILVATLLSIVDNSEQYHETNFEVNLTQYCTCCMIL